MSFFTLNGRHYTHNIDILTPKTTSFVGIIGENHEIQDAKWPIATKTCTLLSNFQQLYVEVMTYDVTRKSRNPRNPQLKESKNSRKIFFIAVLSIKFYSS